MCDGDGVVGSYFFEFWVSTIHNLHDVWRSASRWAGWIRYCQESLIKFSMRDLQTRLMHSTCGLRVIGTFRSACQVCHLVEAKVCRKRSCIWRSETCAAHILRNRYTCAPQYNKWTRHEIPFHIHTLSLNAPTIFLHIFPSQNSKWVQNMLLEAPELARCDFFPQKMNLANAKLKL